ncbi:lipopolysaccharide biosynthesis protein [Sphaerochaeta sp.]|uniref:lipopolysaccharide biosynthesis protein n=1 Tax=Sphaerochaeta sp. TaxID=1972642 RepID=UPI002FC69F12
MELGIGAAICFSLYKPLAFQEIEQIQALMQFYKKAYTLIGLLVIGLGLSLLPFLSFFLGDVPDIPNIRLIYSLFVLNSGCSYFLSYKRTILVADQKKYIDTNYQYGFQIIRIIIQILILVVTRNYILYLVVMLFFTFVENVAIRNKINSLYPFLKDKHKKSLSSDESSQVKKNVIALTFHKIGSVIVNGTDNILMVKFVNLASAGIYANYFMIITALNSVVSIAFNSITASIGNLTVEKQGDASRPFFEQLNFITFWIYGFCSICLILLFNPFISLWLGNEFLFKFPIILAIVFNFYISGVLRSVRTFNASMGLFWYDRYKPLFEASINLIASIILAKHLGIIGVLLGTSISTLTTCTWFEPYILFKYGFESSASKYFLKYLKYTIINGSVGYISFIIIQAIQIKSPFFDFIVSMIACAIIPNILYILVYYRMHEFSYIRLLVQRIRAHIPRGKQ